MHKNDPRDMLFTNSAIVEPLTFIFSHFQNFYFYNRNGKNSDQVVMASDGTYWYLLLYFDKALQSSVANFCWANNKWLTVAASFPGEFRWVLPIDYLDIFGFSHKQ
ncbi:hypothetical protein T12_12217 [Trichinella patagoniensis]|uniref:Uncharacterized protein n=1 Tax=Trichinella patagoniensis TaxID=990121 RepID=A0A0V0ZDH6_9BILA|nr:hypothetical protein T12_9188 [Trichinella patagoniensis]KRY10561.1 hypothetical protein T12_12217 [Trichinella patagoniensis]